MGVRDCEPDDCGLRRIRLAGRFVAYEHYLVERTGSYTFRVVIFDLAARRAAYRSPPTATLDAPQPPRPGLTDLVLSTSGTAAWIAATGQRAPTYVVRTNQGRSGQRELDASSDIEPGSLALARHSVYWMRAGTAQSARV